MSHLTWLLLVRNGRLKKLLRLFGLHIVDLILEERDANQHSKTEVTADES